MFASFHSVGVIISFVEFYSFRVIKCTYVCVCAMCNYVFVLSTRVLHVVRSPVLLTTGSFRFETAQLPPFSKITSHVRINNSLTHSLTYSLSHALTHSLAQ